MGHLCSTVHMGTYHNHLHFFSTSHHHDFTFQAAKYSVLILHKTEEFEHLHIFTVCWNWQERNELHVWTILIKLKHSNGPCFKPFASTPLANIHFLINALSFSVYSSLAGCALLCWPQPIPLFMGILFLINAFRFLPTFLGTQLGCKTWAWCTVFQNVLLPM